jgi:hypothetical protein
MDEIKPLLLDILNVSILKNEKYLNNIIKIQSFFRGYKDRRIAFELRIIPENLFAPEFRHLRLKLTKLDETYYKFK